MKNIFCLIFPVGCARIQPPKSNLKNKHWNHSRFEKTKYRKNSFWAAYVKNKGYPTHNS